jgi:hypothetical protein
MNYIVCYNRRTQKGLKHIRSSEDQIHHEEIKKLDIQLKLHKYYEYFRSYFVEAASSLEGRLEELKLISGGVLVLNDCLLNEL